MPMEKETILQVEQSHYSALITLTLNLRSI